jgi:hypothetical protein
MAVPSDPVEYYRRLLLTDAQGAVRALARVSTEQHARFLAICQTLLDDPAPEVRREVFRLLTRFGDRDDAIATAHALDALNVPALHDAALIVLGTVGTAAAFPVLSSQAEADSVPAAYALASLSAQVRTEAERARVVALARTHLLSTHLAVREAAVDALARHSSAAAEETVLLDAYRRYRDEFVAGFLQQATPAVLPALQALLDSMPTQFVEHQDVARAIQAISDRQTAGTNQRQEG